MHLEMQRLLMGTWTAIAAGGDHGQLVNPSGYLVEDTLAAFTTTGADLKSKQHLYKQCSRCYV